MGTGTVVVIAPDDRWLRVLEATLKLGGYQPIARRSVDEALRLRAGDQEPVAVVLDLGSDAGPDEVAVIRGLLNEHQVLRGDEWTLVVILPEHLRDLRQQFGQAGVEVLVRPYPPSRLYAAIGPAASQA